MKILTVQQWLEWSPDRYKGWKLPFPPDGDIPMGKVLYSEADDTFKITMGSGYRGTYDMAADRILSGRGLLDFVLQIHHKEWITGDHLKDLLDCVTCWVYRDHGKFPQVFFDAVGGINAGLDSP